MTTHGWSSIRVSVRVADTVTVSLRPARRATTRAVTIFVVLALGTIAHNATLRALNLKASEYPFAHAGEHALPTGHVLIDSYHCSRYNTQTGRLTERMFAAVFARAAQLIAQ